ncbi:MCE family protein [Antrihabitans cavernicola]|uniref:MCE family protein n=1 Tax=Antrihabitans cavernicola TaxID=2495913 RepID=A0A5A7S537_9NOCA|nr:MCE family protein [Spelaeibacter cavernicola]KAA0020207.1 MCE family protein [Spelaeibacter cavernicola]
MKRRSPAALGALGIFIVVLATLSAFFLNSLPLIGAGSTYTAQFTEAAGLKPTDEVRIAGVKVGSVSSVDLKGDHVDVKFKAKDAFIGDQTTAAIQIKTVLGSKYLSLEPRGADSLNPNDPIPLGRTTSPYDVIDAFSAAATTLGKIDTPQLADSMKALSAAFADTSPDIRSSLDGVSRLSQTIESRNDQLAKLFAATSKTTKVLADRNEQFTQLLSGAGQLLGELNNRQQAIAQLLTGTQRLSQQLTGLIKDNEAQIGPALQQLRGVVQILQNNNAELDKAIKLYKPFTRLFTNLLGNGRWFDQVVVNLTPPGLPLIPGYRDPVVKLGGN